MTKKKRKKFMFDNYDKLMATVQENATELANIVSYAGSNFISPAAITLMPKLYGKPWTKSYVILIGKQGKPTLEELHRERMEGNNTMAHIATYNNTDKNYKSQRYDFQETLNNIGHYTFAGIGQAIIPTDHGIIACTSVANGNGPNCMANIHYLTFTEQYKDEIEKLIVGALRKIKEKKQDGKLTRNLTLATLSRNGITISALNIKKLKTNIKNNYNDDLPIKQLQKLIKSNKQELILLHGEPGTGKTSLIRHLVETNEKTKFIYFDFHLMTSIANEDLVNFFRHAKGNVLIIEDCEKLFTDRTLGNNFLNTMLNLTDGIIGEGLGIKFICTFNCKPNQIDKAITRKGRLSLIHELKKLTLEKTKKLDKNAKKPMTIAEIYHNNNNNGNIDKQQIGFN